MSFDKTGFAAHLEVLQGQWEAALNAHGYDAAVLPAGAASNYFQDDQAPPFHPSPHFARWFPDANCEHSALLVRPGKRPRLYFYRPADYWYLPPSLPEWAEAGFEVAIHGDAPGLIGALTRDLGGSNHFALIGPAESHDLDLPATAINPRELVNKLHFARAVKTPFEVGRMREATAMGVRGHLAARQTFVDGGSEFDIHLAYLAASSQQESRLPYPSIIALGEHAGILHYQHYDRQRPPGVRSFLIDAGGQAAGYHSDITRTYSATPGDDFDALIKALDVRQRALIDTIRPGLSYVDLHSRMHREIAELLVDFEFVRCSAEAAFEHAITDAFFPHGLGHLLGLQTHDVGGQLANANGDIAPPPARFPSLRYTRAIETGHVFTIEPGLYFIPLLLDKLAASDAADEVHWKRVNGFRPCGGIRIEDNVLVTTTGVENLTRPAFARQP